MTWQSGMREEKQPTAGRRLAKQARGDPALPVPCILSRLFRVGRTHTLNPSVLAPGIAP